MHWVNMVCTIIPKKHYIPPTTTLETDKMQMQQARMKALSFRPSDGGPLHPAYSGSHFVRQQSPQTRPRSMHVLCNGSIATVTIYGPFSPFNPPGVRHDRVLRPSESYVRIKARHLVPEDVLCSQAPTVARSDMQPGSGGRQCTESGYHRPDS